MEHCRAQECLREVRALGLCTMHWTRNSKYGIFEGAEYEAVANKRPPKKSNEERFRNKIVFTPTCWLWKGAINHKGSKGYGRLSVNNKTVRVHRFSYELFYGKIPEGLLVDHKFVSYGCPRHCVNPTHLRLVTNKQNQENLSGALASSKTGVRGVMFVEQVGKYRVLVGHNGKGVNGGYFSNLAEAEAAAKALRNRLYTHNFADREDTNERFSF